MTERRTGWLWWTAFVIVLVGLTVTYLCSLERTNPEAGKIMVLSLAITVIAAGICVIGATAQFWLKR